MADSLITIMHLFIKESPLLQFSFKMEDRCKM